MSTISRAIGCSLVALVGASALAFAAAGCRDDGTQGSRPGTPATRERIAGPSSRPADQPAVKPIAAVRRVLLISVDGLRPDLIFRAPAANIRRLMDEGSFSLWARSAEIPLTLPSHASMLTGVRASRHGIDINEFEGDYHPLFPTMFQVARKSGLSTAFVGGKYKLRVLTPADSVNWLWLDEAEAPAVAAQAVRVLRDHRPDLLVVHFSDCDYAGHLNAWGSTPQLAAVRTIDVALAEILAELDALKLRDETVVILTADHGGVGASHSAGNAASETIPWIARGPGIHRGFDLDQRGLPGVRTEDTFATVCTLLGLPFPPDIDGRMVAEIVDRTGQELLRRAE